MSLQVSVCGMKWGLLPQSCHAHSTWIPAFIRLLRDVELDLQTILSGELWDLIWTYHQKNWPAGHTFVWCNSLLSPKLYKTFTAVCACCWASYETQYIKYHLVYLTVNTDNSKLTCEFLSVVLCLRAGEQCRVVLCIAVKHTKHRPVSWCDILIALTRRMIFISLNIMITAPFHFSVLLW